MGRVVLCVYDLCRVFDGAGGLFENILSCCMDMFGWSRKKACLINCLLLLVLSLPCALGFNLLAEVHPLGGSTTFLDLEDFLVSNIFAASGLSDLCDLRGEQAGWVGRSLWRKPTPAVDGR